MIAADTIARMEARGWKWDAERGRFRAEGGKVRFDSRERAPIGGSIYQDESRWYATYGVVGIGWGQDTGHPTPEAAADEAEAWFRQVVSGLPGVRA